MGRLGSWSERNFIKFNKAGVGSGTQEGITPMHQYRLEIELLESISEEKDLGILLDRVHHEPAICPSGQEGQWSPGMH